jgi:cytochrome P450
MTADSSTHEQAAGRDGGPLLSGGLFKADPYPTYQRMRATLPLYCRRSADGQSAMWFITRAEDVVAALLDDRRFVKDARATLTSSERAAQPAQPPLYNLLTNHMLNSDGPTHERLRRLVNKAFTVRMIEQMEPRVQALADNLLDRVQAKGVMDLMESFAYPLPIHVIAEMLGVPTREQNRFRAWSHALVAPSADTLRNQRKTERLDRLLAERRQTPGADLLSSLLAAEEAGDRLSVEELYSMVLLLVVVGHETAVHLIGTCLLTLLQRPALLERLRNDPAAVPHALEELIRFDGPVERATMRFAACDVTLHGQTIRRGDAVSLVLASANRDPALVERPDDLDLDRPLVRHLGFGHGPHYCLGAPLARLEGRVALTALLRRLPGLRLAVPAESLKWQTNPIVRGVKRLPVVWEA